LCSEEIGGTDDYGYSGYLRGLRQPSGEYDTESNFPIYQFLSYGFGPQYPVGVLCFSPVSLLGQFSYTLSNAGPGYCIRFCRLATESELLLDDGPVEATYTGNNGSVYPCTKIGNYIWMAKNLMETEYRNSSVSVNYGLLYNWYAATDERNICAEGWSIFPFAFLSDTIPSLEGKNSGYRHHVTGVFTNLNTPGTGEMWWTEDFLSDTGNTLSIVNDVVSNGTANVKTGIQIRPYRNSVGLTEGQHGSYTGNDGKVYETVCVRNQYYVVYGTAEFLEIVLTPICETKYQNGDTIPEVTDNSAWAALTTGALCAYDNDWDNAFAMGDNLIPEIQNNTDWANATEGARCSYDNYTGNSYQRDFVDKISPEGWHV